MLSRGPEPRWPDLEPGTGPGRQVVAGPGGPGRLGLQCLQPAQPDRRRGTTHQIFKLRRHCIHQLSNAAPISTCLHVIFGPNPLSKLREGRNWGKQMEHPNSITVFVLFQLNIPTPRSSFKCNGTFKAIIWSLPECTTQRLDHLGRLKITRFPDSESDGSEF